MGSILELGNVMKYLNNGENVLAREFEDCNGLDKMEELQAHPSKEVYKLAYNILTKYYDAMEP